MGDRPDGGDAAGESPERRPPGRTPTYIEELRRPEFLGLLAEGKGIDQALRQMGLGYRAYENTARDDADFRDAVASARRAAAQLLDEVGHLLAQSNPDVLIEVWKRRDAARIMRDAKRTRSAERSQDRRDRLRKERADREERKAERRLRLHLAEMQAEARAKERAERRGDKEEPDDPLPLDRFTPEELAAWRELNRKLLGDDAAPPA